MEKTRVSPPFSPRTIADRQKIVDDALVAGSAELRDKPNLNYASIFVDRPLNVDVGAWVDLKNDHRCKVPLAKDRIWEMPEYGMQGIPMVHFELGLRLPMHPFHLAIFEAVGCGISQLTPNSMAQVSGFIARCAEMGYVPSIRLFLSIFGIKYSRGQVYFDKLTGRSKIVDVRSSNSGWHGKWMYYYGPDLEFIPPCQKVSQKTIDYLTSMVKYDSIFLDRFQGDSPLYTHVQLKDSIFLENHNRKVLLLL